MSAGNQQITISVALREATTILQTGETSAPREDAKLLLRHVLACDKTFLIAHDDYVLTASEREMFFALVERRAKNEPIQHLTGTQEFFGLEFEVSKSVLIPRPETEMLVEIALEILRKADVPRFCEVGVGSGCVAVSILKNLESAQAVGLEISPEALVIARRNAAKHKVENRLQLIESNVFENLTENNSPFTVHRSAFTLVISNPPYIPEIEAAELASEVRDFEPRNALFSGADGFDMIRVLLNDAPKFLRENGYLAFEIGFGQAAKLREIIEAEIWEIVEIRKDWQKIPRIAVLRLVSGGQERGL